MRHTGSGLSLRVALAVLLVAAAVVSPARASQRVVERIRHYAHDGFTRIVLDLDAPAGYKVAGHANPERIAINIPGSRAGRALRNVAVGADGIRRIRVNRLSWGTQVVVDLDRKAEWKHFTLARSTKKSDRIVLDVTPASAAPAPRTTASPSNAPARAADGANDLVYVVAIDAGHGGKDRGATGRYGLIEKKLTLDIARRVADEINAMPGFRAILTRTRDVYLTLPHRVSIAENKGAHLFASIHLNSAPNRGARGVEVFFISPRGAERTASRMLSNPNNAADELGVRGEASSDILHMLVDMNQQAVLQRSEALGEAILRSFVGKSLPPQRAVKQKSFAVLRNITLPSVLVECGFLTNSSDAKIIKDPAGRDRVARAVATGIRSYLTTNPPPREQGRPVVVHKVRRGDTLWKLSREYGSSIASIRQLNRLENSSILRVGQELLIYGRY